MGGDEFVIIITKDIPQFENLLRAFEQRVESWHGEFVESMAVSYGYVFSSERKWNSIFDISKASDERMYESRSNTTPEVEWTEADSKIREIEWRNPFGFFFSATGDSKRAKNTVPILLCITFFQRCLIL